MTRTEELVECVRIKGIRYSHLEKLYKAGWTDAQVADFFGVTLPALHRWWKMNPKLKDLRRDWKEEADEKIERSLYENASGFRCVEEKVFVNFVDKVDVFGNVIGKRRVITRVKTAKQFQPNSTAAIFWLTNRKRQDWRRTREEEAQDPLSVKVYNIVQANKTSKAGGNGHPGGNGNGRGNGKPAGSNGKDLPQVTSSVSVQRGGMRIID